MNSLGEQGGYFDAHEILNETEVRRLWLAEGERRGYGLVDA